jgi:predicted flap endonuclease-1-like 5' DNA nuclease
MRALIAVLRAAHCKSVHHYFAMDALEEVRTDSGRQLSRMLLAHFADYLQGAKDPDTAFKDFQNHVLHVQDGFWGGAAKAAAKWYSEALEHLAAGRWRDASYYIGVLSHYYTDPWMPLHTGQTTKESVVHRPMEWSICCAYDEIMELALSDQSLPSYELPESDAWLKDAIHSSALLSHQFYDELIDTYDMTEARVQPKLALGQSSRKILAQLFTWAISGWAAVLDRMSFESPATVPSFSLTWPTLLATVKVPAARITKAIADVQQKREVEAILHEYLATGIVKRSLPEEQSVVGKARIRYPELLPTQKEINNARTIVSQTFPKHSVTVEDRAEKPVKANANKTESQIVAPESPAKEVRAISAKVRTIPEAKPRSASTQQIKPQPNNNSGRVKRLELDDPIVDAPAIGPKTAARLESIGIGTVRQLLAVDSEALSSKLKASWITPQTIEQWKVQARLVHEIAGLTAAGSGLLFLAGVTNVEEFLRQSIDELHQMVVEASQTSEGQRVLREKSPPSKDILNKWRNRANAHCNSNE